MRLLVVGDTHGNLPFLREYVYPLAARVKVDRIVQVGDFGLWEHHPSGVEFLNGIEDLADEHGIPLYALHGNHDKWSLTMQKYGHIRNAELFVELRAGVFYIPNGHCWQWAGVKMRAFGGAYSVDKQWRLDEEQKRTRKLVAKEDFRRAAGEPAEPYGSAAETLWFPEEQMTDAEMDELLKQRFDRMGIVFSHDFPARANPGEHFKTLPECLPNQLRLQKAMDVHRPDYWFHGHLHQGYQDFVGHTMLEGQEDPDVTMVVGLGCDWDAAPRFAKPWHALAVVDLDDGAVDYTPGFRVQDQADEAEQAAA